MSLVRAETPSRVHRWAGIGLTAALALMAVAMAVPAVFEWDVHVRYFPPLHAEWMPRVGPGSIPAVLLGYAAWRWLPDWCRQARWSRLLVGTWVVSLGWMLALATVDGWDGVGVILETEYEYLGPARDVTTVGAMLDEYIERIPYAHPDNWPPHIAGHPPGALLFFVGLVRLGLGGGLAAGLVVTLLAATVPAAVLLTLRQLGAEHAGRTVAPLLVIGPAALWMSVSGDAVFTAVAAWGMAALATAAVAERRRLARFWALVAGLLLGWCVMMSYGLPLLGVLAVALLLAARTWRPLPWALGAALVVVLAFGLLGGFWWWEALPVLRERYYDGVAGNRPSSYWLWANLAAFAFSAGPMVGASAGATAARLRDTGVRRLAEPDPPDASDGGDRVVLLLCTAGLLMVALAGLSGMSKAEVERIWLPFVPWALLGTALLQDTWRRHGLALQVVTAVVVQHLLFTGW